MASISLPPKRRCFVWLDDYAAIKRFSKLQRISDDGYIPTRKPSHRIKQAVEAAKTTAEQAAAQQAAFVAEQAEQLLKDIAEQEKFAASQKKKHDKTNRQFAKRREAASAKAAKGEAAATIGAAMPWTQSPPRACSWSC